VATVAFLNQKGGVAKSTLSIHVATALALRGNRVLLVDADPQHSALDWQDARQEAPLFSVVGIPTKTLHRDVAMHVDTHDFIIIDGPPRVNELARSAILAADVVLIPVQPSPLDVWAAKEIVDLINEGTVFKTNLKASFVVSRKIVNTAIGRDVALALAEYPIPVFTSAVCQRVVFAESMATGSTVLEMDPNGPAAVEINAITDELLRFI
jgi:chromosome partitioning protein